MSDISIERTIELTVVGSVPRSPLAIIGHSIKLIEGVGYSHLSFFFPDQQLQRLIGYETTLFGGADFISKERFEKKNRVVKTWGIKVTEEEFLRLYRYLWDIEGTRYGVFQIGGLFIKRIIHLITGWEIANPFRNGSAIQVCLETIGLSLALISRIKAEVWDDIGLREIDELLKPFEYTEKG